MKLFLAKLTIIVFYFFCYRQVKRTDQLSAFSFFHWINFRINWKFIRSKKGTENTIDSKMIMANLPVVLPPLHDFNMVGPALGMKVTKKYICILKKLSRREKFFLIIYRRFFDKEKKFWLKFFHFFQKRKLKDFSNFHTWCTYLAPT